MKVPEKVGSFFDHALDILFVLAAVIIAFAWLAVCFDVVMRYFVGQPQAWVLELVEYSLVYTCFLGAAWLLRREGHIMVDTVISRLNARTQIILNSITSILGVMLFLVLTWYTGRSTWEAWQESDYFPTILELPKAPIYAVMPVGSFLLLIQFLRRTYGYCRKWRVPPKEGKKSVEQSL